MTSEERLSALEQEVARLRSVLQEFGTHIQEQGGEQNMLFAVTLALIESTSNPAELGPILKRELSAVESKAVFEATHEGQLVGAQAAHANILRALEFADKKTIPGP